MNRHLIRFQSTDDIAEFVRIVNQFDCDIDLRKDHVTMDAKSFLGILSMSATEQLEMVIHAQEYEDILKRVQTYLI